MVLRLSDLQGKDMVDMLDGKKMGNIVDISINNDGSINNFMVEKKRLFIFFSSSEVEVKWKQIEKIGEDVILVNLTK